MKTLLFQVRDDPRVRREELTSFLKFSGLEREEIEVLNVFDKPNFNPNIIDGYDALFVGGASEASVLEPEKHSFVEKGKSLLMHCLKKDIPVFASCYGFQLAVLALGGKIVKDTVNFEMGVIPIKLTEAAKKDPLYRDTPSPFPAISVHQEKALELPEGCELLAFTDECTQSFRVTGKKFWAFQFHPEVDRATIVERLTIYKKKYTRDDQHLKEILDATVETPESNNLLRKFVDRVLR